jgi:hypothetical protein
VANPAAAQQRVEVLKKLEEEFEKKGQLRVMGKLCFTNTFKVWSAVLSHFIISANLTVLAIVYSPSARRV